MGEQSLSALPFDRNVEQAILAMKKGAHLLKCGRRGKPKFCPFKLSTDERYLIWYSRQEEKHLRLSLVTKIIRGQKTVNFQKNLQPDKVEQSFSLLYANGQHSLDLISKDKEQADSWFIGLRAVISRCHRASPFAGFSDHRGAQSCVNSPAGFIRRKYNLGIVEDGAELSQVRSLCGSPTDSFSERCLSEVLSFSSDNLNLSESLPQMPKAIVACNPSPYVEQNISMRESGYACSEFKNNKPYRSVVPTHGSRVENDALRDVLLWGQGVEGGHIGGGLVIKYGYHNRMQLDAALPKLMDSTAMLDVESVSLGGKHAALVTRQGEVFCWGEGSGGKLGHKVDFDVTCPKVVESLEGVHVKSIACGEYQTCALTHFGEVYTWGDYKNGVQFGDENHTRSNWLPHKLSGILDGVTISSVACGEWHTAMVSSSGSLFTVGDGTFGALGHGDLQSVSQPKEVESLKGLKVKSVACGSWHTAAIVDVVVNCFKFSAVGGKLFTWGDGDKGRLGHNDMQKKLVPTCVTQLVDHHFVQVSCGRMLTVALTNMGKVYTMGSSSHGQLGNPHAHDKSVTIVEGDLKQEFVKQISSGSYHVVALTSTGCVYTWGKGTNGQLGLGNIDDKNTPHLVEALRDRHVKKIACGSNLTAAICLHKPISISDQSACAGCRMPFGFTRKKRNCYNCGLLFCSTCSSNKTINASLAPVKSKPSRVCDSCFNILQKITHSGRIPKLENHCSRQALPSLKNPRDGKEENGELSPRGAHHLSIAESCDVEKQRKKQQHDEPIFSSGLPRWGQVPCPVTFDSYCDEYSTNQADNLTSSVLSSGNLGEPHTSNLLVEQVQRLKEEVRNLEMQCEIGGQKIRECQEALEKTWSVAREEAAKRKAANEIIKVLALKLGTISEKVSSEKESTDGNDQTLSQRTPAHTDGTFLAARCAVKSTNHLIPDIKIPQERQADSLSNSPIVFSSKLRSIGSREVCHDNRRLGDDPDALNTGCKQNGSKDSSLEWVEQYEPGVYITFTILPGGQKGLKRVRFSRKRFAEKEAAQWWEENQINVYQKYGIERYDNINQNQTKC